MPRVTISNNTRVAGSALPNGVKLVITVGNASPVNLEVGQTGTYNVANQQLITIKPENKMMQGATYVELDGNDKNLSIIPSDELNIFGVKIG
jgi:hypothetical protein